MTGFEPLIGAATAGLAGLITSVIKEGGSGLLKKADIDLFKGAAFNRAMQKYVSSYARRHGELKVACVRMDRPIKLDEIYTAVQLLPRSALRYYESTESLQELFRESGKRGFNFEGAEKQQGITVANQQQYLMVLGGPGVGKSTFLRKMGLEALRRHAIVTNAQGNLDALKPQEHYYAHACIPVLLELRQFNSQELSIKEIIAQEFEVCGFPKAQEFTELFLQSGKLLVLLDGLDEVPGDTLNYAITEIENLVDRYDGNRFIASCRVAAYTFGGFKHFNDVAMAAFEDNQIERFINNWFQKPRDIKAETSKRCWQLLSSPDYQAAKELAQTPLLLTLLCVIYDEFQDFPKHRYKVYGEALDVLLRKWAAEKRIKQEPIYQKFGADLELDLLSELAYNSFVDNQLFFPRQTVLAHIQDFQAENENAPELDAAQILTEIEVEQGILVERSRDTYSFSHLTFQEYLTAKCIVDNQKVDPLARDHLTDQRWQEVFLLVAGLAPGKQGADALLLAMERFAQRSLDAARLKGLVAWADTATQNTPGNAQSSAKRTAALARALDLILDLDLVRGSGGLDLDRGLTLARSLARGLALALDLAPSLARVLGLARALTRALDLDLACALAFDLRLDPASAPASARARALDLDFACNYLKSGIFKPERLEALIQKLEALDLASSTYRLITEFWIKEIGINEDLLTISEEEFDSLNDYLYSVELMVRCKDAAVRVSPSVWVGIESRILTVPSN